MKIIVCEYEFIFYEFILEVIFQFLRQGENRIKLERGKRGNKEKGEKKRKREDFVVGRQGGEGGRKKERQRWGRGEREIKRREGVIKGERVFE